MIEHYIWLGLNLAWVGSWFLGMGACLYWIWLDTS